MSCRGTEVFRIHRTSPRRDRISDRHSSPHRSLAPMNRPVHPHRARAPLSICPPQARRGSSCHYAGTPGHPNPPERAGRFVALLRYVAIRFRTMRNDTKGSGRHERHLKQNKRRGEKVMLSHLNHWPHMRRLSCYTTTPSVRNT